jgi:hypothetical protein
MEKDRARQELRALLADPAAGFAALPGGQFFAALKQACQDGTANLALIAEYERRITSGEAGPRELDQVLFAASDRHAWAGVRVLALAAAGQVPGTAVAVVGLEAQRLGVAPMQVANARRTAGSRPRRAWSGTARAWRARRVTAAARRPRGRPRRCRCWLAAPRVRPTRSASA